LRRGRIELFPLTRRFAFIEVLPDSPRALAPTDRDHTPNRCAMNELSQAAALVHRGIRRARFAMCSDVL
jgi:hypothetical protein